MRFKDGRNADIFLHQYIDKMFHLRQEIVDGIVEFNGLNYTVDYLCFKPVAGKPCMITSVTNFWLDNYEKFKNQTDEEIKEKALSLAKANGKAFADALKKEQMSFICEVKKASPSKGIISEDFPYLDIAKRIGNPRGARAVGGAVGSNPVLSIIPCHRVICSSGKLGGFHWGIDKKIKLLNKEARGSKKREGAYNWEPTFF